MIEEYRKQEAIGLKKEKDIEAMYENLFQGVCLEIIRRWLSGKAGRLRDAKDNKEIKIMIDKLDKQWVDFRTEIKKSDDGYFRKFMEKSYKKLYAIWTYDDTESNA